MLGELISASLKAFRQTEYPPGRADTVRPGAGSGRGSLKITRLHARNSLV
jgi:hypothetical protein